MCKKKTADGDADSKSEDVDDAESKERLIQAKRLWNLRWCYNWYNRKCELEQKLNTRRQVNHQDMLLNSNLNLCVIQQILKVASTDPNNSSGDLFSISETEEEVAEDVTAETSPPPDKPLVGRKKFKLLKTPLHYIRVLKNKVLCNQKKYGNKATLNNGERDIPLLASEKKSSREEYEQRGTVPSRLDKSCDLIDFVSGSKESSKCGLLVLQCPACRIQQVIRAMGLNLQSPLNPEVSDGPSHLLRAEWKESSAGERVSYVANDPGTETFPRGTALQLLEESTHSPLCAYYIIRTIVRIVITSHFYNFLKNCKKRNVIENNLAFILRNAEDNHFMMSFGWRNDLYSSPSCPALHQFHSTMITNVNHGIDKMSTSSYARGMYGAPRQRGGLPNEVNFPRHSREGTATASHKPCDYLLVQPQLYCAGRSYAAAKLNDPEKSKTL